MAELSFDALLARVQATPASAPASSPGRRGLPWEQMLARLDALSDQYKVPRELSRAVVKQESNWDPYAVGDGGQAKGWFQLHPGAAKDAGIDPNFRHEPDLNMLGGVRYLAQKYKQAGGNWEKALTLYNGGGDPQYVQHVRRHIPQDQQAVVFPQAPPERRTLMSRVVSAVTPRSAEAAELSYDQLMHRLGQPTQAPQGPQTPQPPTARSTPEQDAAYRAWAAQQPAGAPPPPSAAATPSPTPAPGTAAPMAPLPREPGHPPATSTGEPVDLVIDIEKESPPGTAAPTPPAASPLPPREDRLAPPKVPLDLDTALEHELSGARGAMLPWLTQETGVRTGMETGRRLGRLFGPRGEAIGGILGAGVGGIAGNVVNRETGMTPTPEPWGEVGGVPIYTEDVVAGATPALIPLIPKLPGAARYLHERGAQVLKDLGVRLEPAVDSGTLFTRAAATGDRIPMHAMWQTAGDIMRGERALEKEFQSGTALKQAQALLTMLRQKGNRPEIALVESYRERLRLLRDSAENQVDKRNLGKLYDALYTDLDTAGNSGSVGAADLKQALRTYRQEKALEDLRDMWSDGKGIKIEEGDVTRVYGKTIQNQFERRLSDDTQFKHSWSAADLADIRATLREVASTTAQSPVGSLRGDAFKHALATAASILGLQMSGPGGAAAGFAVGEVLPLLLAKAMQSAPGRAAIREALRGGNGMFTPTGIVAITRAIQSPTRED